MSLDSIHDFHVKSCSQGNALLEGKKSFPAARQHRKQVIHFFWNKFCIAKLPDSVVISDALDEEKSMGYASTEFHPKKKTQRGGDCGFVPYEVLQSPGKGKQWQVYTFIN